MKGAVESFDVFDTVLTRRVGMPSTVFLLLGERARAQGLIRLDAPSFAQQRRDAEKACRQRHPGRETTLSAICRELTERLKLPVATAAQLEQLELEMERALICVMPGATAALQAARAAGSRVIFVSDMYVSSDFLRERLREHGCFAPEDGLYVSSEHPGTKHTGRLFAEVLRLENRSASEVHHRGNHVEADVNVPRRLGLRATLEPGGNLNRYEQLLERFTAATHGLTSWHAGASRLARLSVPAATPAATAVREVTAGVAGPVLVAYVSWVLREARRRGIERLQFVARDGWLLLQLARQLAPLLHPTAELGYLRGSRQAWHLPGIRQLGEAEFAWLYDSPETLSVALVCRRLQLEGPELEAALHVAGFPSAARDTVLSPAQRLRLREALSAEPLARLVRQQASATGELLRDYLSQEHLLNGRRWALVDVGWHGRAHDSLAKLIHSAGGAPPAGFYFGLNSRSGLTGLGERHAWFFDRREGDTNTRAFPGIEPLLEVFCTTREGTTTGYARTAQGIAPVLGPEPRLKATWPWPTVEQTLAAYGREFARAPQIEANEDTVRDACAALLREFWENPTPAEAAAWGAFPYEDDQASSATLPLAAPLPWSLAPALLVRGGRGLPRASWWQGSAQLTPPLRRYVLNGIRSVRQGLRHWRGKTR